MADERKRSAGNTSEGMAEPTGGEFGEVLRRLRMERGVSQAALAARAGMDRSYINRIEAGERGAPTLTATEALADALELDDAEADRLFAAAGVLPRSLRALGPSDPTLLVLAQALTDASFTEEARSALRTTVETIVRHWAHASPRVSPPSSPAATPRETHAADGSRERTIREEQAS